MARRNQRASKRECLNLEASRWDDGLRIPSSILSYRRSRGLLGKRVSNASKTATHRVKRPSFFGRTLRDVATRGTFVRHDGSGGKCRKVDRFMYWRIADRVLAAAFVRDNELSLFRQLFADRVGHGDAAINFTKT